MWQSFSAIAPGKAIAITRLTQASVKQVSEEQVLALIVKDAPVKNAPVKDAPVKSAPVKNALSGHDATESATSKDATSKRATLSELLQTIPDRPTAPIPAPVDTTEKTETVSLELHLGEKRVYVYKGESVEVSYPVAIGRPSWETPTGEFES
ncbi:MAG: L,D-transpeptidase [Phormidesmis sp.]